MIQRELPAGGPDAVCAALYAGAVFLLPASPPTHALAADVARLLEEEFGTGPFHEAQFRLTPDEFFNAAGRVRRRVYLEAPFPAHVAGTMQSLGFEPDVHAYDPLRLRVNAHAAGDNPDARPVYYAHRDTWYANPQCQINWWVPLHDVSEEETFVFFPEYFARPVENDSRDFDYDEWMQGGPELRIGWQNPGAGRTAHYPAFFGDLGKTPRVGFSARAGELLLFSSAHLHQTVPHRTRRTRFSVDFRTAHMGDHTAGIGAPNVDNGSTGSALRDYVLPGVPWSFAAGHR